MHEKTGNFSSFVARRLARRENFPHAVVAIPKPYPDSQLFFERCGVDSAELERGRFCQLNLYATECYGLPDTLFTDPEINWHHQQFGRKGLIGAAGLWINGSVATISSVQSDLFQQLYRHADLGKSCKSQVNKHFKHWHVLLFNAVLDFCIDRNIAVLRSPTAQQITAFAPNTLNPRLFSNVYDYPREHYRCGCVDIGSAQFWEIPVMANADRVMRLSASNRPEPQASPRICIFHDIEGNIDTNISPSACADNLTRMLEIEKTCGVTATYDIVGTLFSAKYEEIKSANDEHAIGFHSFDHNTSDLTQLTRCRQVDERVRGFRPARSLMTTELTDYNLTFFNFEWFASSAGSLHRVDCGLQNGIVKIPIHQDDYPLFIGDADYDQWEQDVLDLAERTPVFGLGLHDCYGGAWLRHYPELIEKLKAIGDLVSAEAVSDEIFMNAPFESGGRDTDLQLPRSPAEPMTPQARRSAAFAMLTERSRP